MKKTDNAESTEKKYKTTKRPQSFKNHKIRPYDLWEAGECPVCGWYYEGDLIGQIKCPVCGQLID